MQPYTEGCLRRKIGTYVFSTGARRNSCNISEACANDLHPSPRAQRELPCPAELKICTWQAGCVAVSRARSVAATTMGRPSASKQHSADSLYQTPSNVRCLLLLYSDRLPIQLRFSFPIGRAATHRAVGPHTHLRVRFIGHRFGTHHQPCRNLRKRHLIVSSLLDTHQHQAEKGRRHPPSGI